MRSILPIIGLLLLASISGCGNSVDTEPAEKVAQTFMLHLRDGQFIEAFNLCSTDYQRDLGNPHKMGNDLKTAGMIPAKWSIKEREGVEDGIELRGDLTFSNNKQGSLKIKVKKKGVEWKVTGLKMSPR